MRQSYDFFSQLEPPFLCRNCFLNEFFFQISIKVGFGFGSDRKRNLSRHYHEYTACHRGMTMILCLVRN